MLLAGVVLLHEKGRGHFIQLCCEDWGMWCLIHVVMWLSCKAILLHSVHTHTSQLLSLIRAVLQRTEALLCVCPTNFLLLTVLSQLLSVDGSTVTQEAVETMIRACDYNPPATNMETLFSQQSSCSLDHFERWIKGHPHLSSFSRWVDGGIHTDMFTYI